MSLKGRDFNDLELQPRSIREGDPNERKAWIYEQNERWKIVDECDQCGRPLVAEEVVSHRMNHVPELLRPLARDMVRLTPEQRVELMRLFSSRTGKLAGAE